MFRKILIANRGEIACRVAKTARKMGLQTVAVYSEVDAGAQHVKLCDEAYCIGAAASSESYLLGDKIIQVAIQSGAEAIHPGYGFLSENAEFSRQCAENNIVFIGPPAAAIVAMGSKSESKALMLAAGVPVVPGYHGDEQSPQTLAAASANIGFPQLIKATAGGGGKGMRVVEKHADFIAALESCQREAKASFGDDKVLIERYLTAPRHVELQIFADNFSNCVHLFERDCSIQRRHQKVLEEAPAPGLDDNLRSKMADAAIAAAKAIQYVGAGTVEFLLDADGSFYFMEMNTRLQVEHPVTEMISAQDLVEWQLRVAAGEPLPLQQQALKINGHAFEARIYAETPERDFLPASGTLQLLQPPPESAAVRIDSGVVEGDEVSVYYDPLIAKLIVWGQSRAVALRKMQLALNEYRIIGLNTNLRFLSRIFSHPAFVAADLDTGFIGHHEADLFPQSGEVPIEVLALACLFELLREGAQSKIQQSSTADPDSPWGLANGWRLNQDSFNEIHLNIDGKTFRIPAHYCSDGFELELDDGNYFISGSMSAAHRITAQFNNRRLEASILQQQQSMTILYIGDSWVVEISDPRQDGFQSEVSDSSLVSPMPGAVVAVHVGVGDPVQQGDALIVVEAMKMEHAITAPQDGTVGEIFYQVGDQVEEGDELLSLE